MKKILIFTGALLLSVCAVAQNPDTKPFRRADGKIVTIENQSRDSLGVDTLRRIGPNSSDLVSLRDGSDGSVLLEVGGFGLTLGRTPAQKLANKPSRMWVTALSDMEIGFTQLTGVDYAGYSAEERGFLDQRLGKSVHFSFSVLQFCVSLNQKRNLTLGIGFQYTLDNYRLMDNGIMLGNANGRIVPLRLENPADKSKAVVSALGVPVRLIYYPAKHLRLTAVAYSDFVLGADAIVKKPKQKEGLSGFRTYQFGVGASAAYRGLGLYARYGVTPLFKTDAGPAGHTVSFGFSYTLFLDLF